MNKIAVVFWSGTGNTETMAAAVKAGAEEKGAEVAVFSPADFTVSQAETFDAIAFGCPAMGVEVLEEEEFQPMFDSVKGFLGGKAVALFGSYGWGGGEWMHIWEDDCASSGIQLVTESVICADMPDDDTLAACRALGASLT